MGSGSKKAPAVPEYTGGITRIAGRDVATNTKEGNNIVTTYNPSAGVQEANTFVESQLTPLYKSAMTPQDFGSYADTYKQNQLADLNESYRQGLNTAKGALVSSGQSSSSQGLDQLQAFNKPYMQQQANINAQAPLQAQQMQSNQQTYDTANLANLMNILNQYYNTGNTFMGTAANASNNANSFYNQQFSTNASMYNAEQASKAAMYSAFGNAASGAFSGLGAFAGAAKGAGAAASSGSALASDKKVKKNIVKIGEKNGINIYEFEYKTDKYPELPEGRQIGVIAQEVEHIPNAVVQGDKYKLVDYAVILPLIA